MSRHMRCLTGSGSPSKSAEKAAGGVRLARLIQSTASTATSPRIVRLMIVSTARATGARSCAQVVFSQGEGEGQVLHSSGVC